MIIAFAVLAGLVLSVINLWVHTRSSRQQIPVQPVVGPSEGQVQGHSKASVVCPRQKPEKGDLRIQGCPKKSLSALMGHWILEKNEKCNGKAYYFRPTRTRILFLYCSETSDEWKVNKLFYCVQQISEEG
jgi:hypothetical protein